MNNLPKLSTRAQIKIGPSRTVAATSSPKPSPLDLLIPAGKRKSPGPKSRISKTRPATKRQISHCSGRAPTTAPEIEHSVLVWSHTPPTSISTPQTMAAGQSNHCSGPIPTAASESEQAVLAELHELKTVLQGTSERCVQLLRDLATRVNGQETEIAVLKLQVARFGRVLGQRDGVGA